MDKNNLFEPKIMGDENNTENNSPNLDEIRSLDEGIIEKKQEVEESTPEKNESNDPFGNKFLFNDMEEKEEPVKEEVNTDINNDTNNNDDDIIGIKFNNGFTGNQDNNDSVHVDTNKFNNSSDTGANFNFSDNEVKEDNFKPVNTEPKEEVKDTKKGGKLKAIISSVLVVLIGSAITWYFTSGKENGTIVCTKDNNGIKEEYTIVIENGKYSKGYIKDTMDLAALASQYGINVNDIDTSQIEICSSVTSQNSSIYSYKNCKEKVENNILIAEVEMQINVTDKSVGSVKEMKKAMEEEGLTCTVK